MNPGFIKFFAWIRDFNPSTQQNTSAQVWVKFYGIPQEYWRKRILFAIGSSIGTPICTDVATAKPMWERTFGQYARILVDMDVSQPLRSKVLVERTGYAFFVDIGYENLPDYCSHCNKIGHYLEICKNVRKEETGVQGKDQPKAKKISKGPKYVRKEQGKTQINPIVIPEQVIEVNLVRDQNKGKAVLVDENADANKSQEPEVNAAVIEEDEDSTSTGSEFVDDTEIGVKTGEASDNEVTKDADMNQEMLNRQFLQQSWANIAENDAAEAGLLAAIEKEHDRDDADEEVPNNANDFQMVITKKKKKQQRVAQNKSLYTTRSRTGKTKPLQ